MTGWKDIHPQTVFLTIKDHKENFPSKISCRLIAPSKYDLRKVSKSILQNIVHELNDKLKLNQWRDPAEVTQWFNKIRCKRKAAFVKFDICSFYPSISKDLLLKALTFAQSHMFINKNDIDIILAARRSFLFHNGNP